MRVKEGDETEETVVEKEGEGTKEHISVFEEAQKQLYSAEGNGKGENGIGKWKWANLKNIGKLLALLVGLGGTCFSYCEFIREDVTTTIRRTAVAIANLPHKSIPDYYIPREDVVQNLQTMIDTQSSHYLPTIIVYGPCGSGKSTAVQIAVNKPNRKRRPVLMARVTSTDITSGEGDFERLAYKIIYSAIQQSRPLNKSTSVSIPQGTLASSILTGALKRVKQLPIIVLEVDVKFTTLQLQQLLLQLKSWGTDYRLAQFIIVLSSAYTALGLTTSVGELWSQFVPVTDLKDAEVQEFLQSRFPNLSKGVIEKVRKRVGNRILHLVEVAVKTETLTQKKQTERDLLVIADRYAANKQREHTAGLNFFLEKFKTMPSASLFETILLQKEQLSLENFSKAFGKAMQEMVDVLAEHTPHSFYIDPETLVVTVGSHFMEKAIREKFAESKDGEKFAELKDNTLKQPTQ